MAIVTREVFSSNVAKLSYDDDPPTLLVYWAKGKVSAYDGVPYELFDRISKAPSVGAALNEEVKGRYRHHYV